MVVGDSAALLVWQAHLQLAEKCCTLSSVCQGRGEVTKWVPVTLSPPSQAIRSVIVTWLVHFDQLLYNCWHSPGQRCWKNVAVEGKGDESMLGHWGEFKVQCNRALAPAHLVPPLTTPWGPSPSVSLGPCQCSPGLCTSSPPPTSPHLWSCLVLLFPLPFSGSTLPSWLCLPNACRVARRGLGPLLYLPLQGPARPVEVCPVRLPVGTRMTQMRLQPLFLFFLYSLDPQRCFCCCCNLHYCFFLNGLRYFT